MNMTLNGNLFIWNILWVRLWQKLSSTLHQIVIVYVGIVVHQLRGSMISRRIAYPIALSNKWICIWIASVEKSLCTCVAESNLPEYDHRRSGHSSAVCRSRSTISDWIARGRHIIRSRWWSNGVQWTPCSRCGRHRCTDMHTSVGRHFLTGKRIATTMKCWKEQTQRMQKCNWLLASETGSRAAILCAANGSLRKHNQVNRWG